MADLNNSNEETGTTTVVAKVDDETVRRLPVYTSTRRMVTVEEIRDGIFWSSGNWRKEIDYVRRSPEMWESLKKVGQTDPFVCRLNKRGDAEIEVGQGHTRERAVLYGIETDGFDAVAALFPLGFMVDLAEGLTDSQFALLKLDNANSENMRKGTVGQLDWTMAALGLIRAGCTRKEIALQLEHQTELLFPKDKDKGKGEELVNTRTRLEELSKDIVECRKDLADTLVTLEGQDETVIEAATAASKKLIAGHQREIDEKTTHVDYLIVEIRKGTMDRLTNHWNGGPYLDALLYQKAHGKEDPEAPEGLRTVKMTYSVKGKGLSGIVAQCGAASRKDQSVSSGFISIAQRGRVAEGAEFQAVWKKFRDHADKKKDPEKDDETKLKAMPAKDMVKDGATRESSGFQHFTRLMAGLEDRESAATIEKAKKSDSLLYIAEVVSEGDKDFWRTQVLSKFKSLEDARKAEAAKAISNGESSNEAVTEETAEAPKVEADSA